MICGASRIILLYLAPYDIYLILLELIEANDLPMFCSKHTLQLDFDMIKQRKYIGIYNVSKHSLMELVRRSMYCIMLACSAALGTATDS
jgi:hypothetical protein